MSSGPSRSDVVHRMDSGAYCESCSKCGQRLPFSKWCQHCEKKQFQNSFVSWTSGSGKLDKLIRSSQNKA
ncbi:18556_t:CDS:1, partial [Acaulospora morrowiae]